MKKIRKNSKGKYLIPVIIVLVAALLASVAILIYIHTQNYINVEYIDKNSKTTGDDVTKLSPIIINNVIVGGVSDKGKFISKSSSYSEEVLKVGSEIDMYNVSGKVGTFEIYSLSQDKDRNINYAIPLRDIANQEYIAVAKSDNNIMKRQFNKLEAAKEDEKYVKKALGKYKLLNNTVQINEVYEGYLNKNEKIKIITATSSGKNMFGVYSIVVFVQNGRSEIIKYSYVKNTKSSIDWPVYSVKFACDLNNDDNYEIVIQEARELTMKYSVLEYNKDKYYEVLGLKFKIK